MNDLRWMRRVLFALIASLNGVDRAPAVDADRPNIVWLTSEDHGPHLGCYGDTYAETPQVDRFAARGMRYAHAWSCAPVCAPARTTLMWGMYATSLGGQHMRSMAPAPSGKQMFPQLLREAGYYCTNNAKEDYNIAQPGQVWDESSRRAHWSNRRAGQPFFAVFNSTKSHEGQIRAAADLKHDPRQARVPVYHPDTPEVRRDWARYYDTVSEADADAGARLRELDEAGLAESTIVFYFADHGSGMPRSKRSACNSGLQVPLVVYIPEAWSALRGPDYAADGVSQRLVSFVDFAPTVLSLAGIRPPDWMQGRAFLGSFVADAPQYVFGFRDRMDERYDLVRSASDGRYVYVRNFMPQRIYGQHVSYMFQTTTTQVWRQRHEQGQLSAPQDAFWNTKPAEELYDLQSDPDEVHNLASSPAHAEIVQRFRDALRAWILEVRDVGFLPEGEVHARSAGASPYDMARDADRYPLARVLTVAERASLLQRDDVPWLCEAMGDEDSAVRYWAIAGLLMRGSDGMAGRRDELLAALADESPLVRIVAAEALARYAASNEDRQRGLETLAKLADWSRSDVFSAMSALNALDAVGAPASPIRKRLRDAAAAGASPHTRYQEYVPRLLRGGQ